MINHARTLLLNKPAGYFSGVTGSEYIQPDFVPVPLDLTLTEIKNAIMPQSLDALGNNIVVGSLMKLLHSPDIVTYTLALDNRITYAVDSNELAHLVDLPVSIISNKGTSCDVVPRYSINEENIPTDLGSAGKHVWTFRPLSTRIMEVAHNRGETITQDIRNSVNPQRSKPITLVPNYLQAYFELPSETLTGEFKFEYTAVFSVPYNVADRLAELETLLVQPGKAERLFAIGANYGDRIALMNTVWKQSPEAILRFSSAVLAYIYQVEELRLGNTRSA